MKDIRAQVVKMYEESLLGAALIIKLLYSSSIVVIEYIKSLIEDPMMKMLLVWLVVWLLATF